MSEREEVETFSGLVGLLRERVTHYIREGIAGARSLRDGVRLRGEPLRVGGRLWDGRVAAADGGSCTLPFADRSVGFVAAISVLDDGGGFRRRFRGDLIVQAEGEDDGAFSDRLDVEREAMMLSLAAEAVSEASLLIVDGPLIPRPKYVGEYVYQLRHLIEEAERAGTALVGFVKRPQSRFLEELEPYPALTDRAALYMVLDNHQAYPWPPRRREGVLYTYIRLAMPPHAGVFRIDAPEWMGEEGVMEALRHIVASSDPQRFVPAILAKADEEVKMSRRLVKDIYREAFERETGGVDPRLWSLVTLRWGEE